MKMVKSHIDTKIDTIKSVTDAILIKGFSPYIGANGHWYVFDTETKEFEDTGVVASSGVSADAITSALGYNPADANSLANKVDKIVGKGLSENDYTNEDKAKLTGIEEGANKYDLPSDVPHDSNYQHTDNNYTNAAKAKVDAIPSNPKYTDTVYDDTEVREDITSLNEDIANKVADVKINGTSIVNDDKVAEIPIGSANDFGVFKVGATYGTAQTNGVIRTYKATDSDIDARNHQYRPIVPNNLDYAVKSAMCDGVGAEWSASEKLSARQRMGLDNLPTDVKINGTSVVNADKVAEIPIVTNNSYGVVGVNNWNAIQAYNGRLSPLVLTKEQYDARDGYSFVGKGTLENVLSARIAEPQFELIEEITLTEDSVFSRNTEPNGTPYAFKAVNIDIYTPSGTAQAKSYYCSYGDSFAWTKLMMSIYFTSVIRYTRVELERKNGKWFGICASSLSTISDVLPSNIRLISPKFSECELQSIDGINFNEDFPSGTNIKIYGVRA